MSKINLRPSLKIKWLRFAFFILTGFFISASQFTEQHWHRSSINIKHIKSGGYIYIQCRFIHYEFALFGEHGYLEWVNFAFTVDGLHYKKLLRCEVNDQLKMNTSWIFMRDKLLGANILVLESDSPESASMWLDDKQNTWIKYNNIDARSIFFIKWFVPSHLKIKNILVTGKWHVSGLRCSDEIDGEVYDVSDNENLNSEIIIDIKQQNIIDKYENNTVKVLPDVNAVVVKGAKYGENIQVYASTGTLVNTMVANKDVVKIKLPVNQMYIVNVGQACYKVDL